MAVPVLPAAQEKEESTVYQPLSGFIQIKVEPVGWWFKALLARHRNRHTTSIHSPDENDDSEEEASEEDEEQDDDVEYLRRLDPKDWKNQDHYAVLGLKGQRHRASDDAIKRAYRKKVLRHHPDKRHHAGENVKDIDHDYFSCITKAYDILGNSTKRRSYDSVDPDFDDNIPSTNSHSREHFIDTFAPIFERNARWSSKHPVPLLGSEVSTFEEVDTFYKFWYEFDSWREFSYLDEEEKEKGENRDERKWIEKQNRAARQKRKKEEMARIRQLVDNAYACDPRIQKFKDEERQRKMAQKKARQEAVRARAEEEEKRKQEALEAERQAREKEEEDTRLQREKEKKEKDALKKQTKKERRTLQQLCDNSNYFADTEAERLKHLQEVDKLSKLLSLERLQALTKSLQENDRHRARQAFLDEVTALNDRLTKEKEELVAASQRMSAAGTDSNAPKSWSHDDLQLLVKAVNLFPAGTSNRWEVAAEFISQHSAGGIIRTAKEVLAKAKNLQKLGVPYRCRFLGERRERRDVF